VIDEALNHPITRSQITRSRNSPFCYFRTVRVLAGDIGGTKTAVAIVDVSDKRLSVHRYRKYESARFDTLEEILSSFLEDVEELPRAAGFGVAGPVESGRARVTKLPWVVEGRRLEREIGIAPVRVINDFVAAAYGLPYLRSRQLVTLRTGRPEPKGPIGLIGAGTGLGQAALFWSGDRYEAVASEGGHADFGPRDAREDRLVAFLRERYGRVSRDRILSGEGLGHLYDFLKSDGFAPESSRVARAFLGTDRAAVISRFGLQRRDRLCGEALRLFASIYGSEAGNLAIQYRASGGLFLAGGIAPRILPALRGRTFLASFSSKPPMEELLARVPVRLVRDPRLPLFGAASAAYWIAIETTRLRSKTRTRPARR
jgi:glucokinase